MTDFENGDRMSQEIHEAMVEAAKADALEISMLGQTSAATEDLRAENARLRQALKDLAEHRGDEEPTSTVVEAFQILEDEQKELRATIRRVWDVVNGRRHPMVAAWILGVREGEERLTSVSVLRLHDIINALTGEDA